MNYPPEKRRPATREERLHREIGQILETKYNDPHSRQPFVDTDREADAWYNLLSPAEKAWVRKLFYSEIQNNDETERDRGDLLDAIGRWDLSYARTFAITFWKSLPTESYLDLQSRIVGLKYFPYNPETESYLLIRFAYWEKKLFLRAHNLEWQYYHSAKSLLQAIANVIARNSFVTGLEILPRCIMLTHRGTFDDYHFLLMLTRSQPFIQNEAHRPLTQTEMKAITQRLQSQDPQYILQLKQTQERWSTRAEPMASIIESLPGSG